MEMRVFISLQVNKHEKTYRNFQFILKNHQKHWHSFNKIYRRLFNIVHKFGQTSFRTSSGTKRISKETFVHLI